MIPTTPQQREAAWRAQQASIAQAGGRRLRAGIEPTGTSDADANASEQVGDRSSRRHRWLLALAIAFQLGALPVLWNEAYTFPALLWTGTGTVLMLAAVLSDDTGIKTDRLLLQLVGAFVVLYPAFCLLSYFAIDRAAPERFEMLGSNATLMALALLYFLFGASIARQPLSSGLVAALVIAGAYGLAERASFSPQEIYERMQFDGVRVDYQYLGDAFVLASLMALPRFRRPSSRLAFAVLAVVIMFTIPSRSAAFFGLVALIPGVLAWSRGATRVTLVALLLMLLFSFHLLPLDSWFAGTRFESILTGSTDTSIDLRAEVLAQGQRVITEHPLLGYWGFQLDVFGTSGLYVHNVLDLWVQAGIVPFTLFLVIWAIAAWRCLHLWRTDPQAGLACAPLLLFAALSWLLSRNGAYVLLFMTLGYLAGMLGKRQAIDAQIDLASELPRGGPNAVSTVGFSTLERS